MESIDSGKQCLFCNPSFYDGRTIKENRYWYAICDGYPVTQWHTLIIPKRHIASPFQLTLIEFLSLFFFIRKVKKIVVANSETNNFNIGINDGEDAGQTIPHLHIHLIPRHSDDGGLPCGVRNVFPKEIANYREKVEQIVAY